MTTLQNRPLARRIYVASTLFIAASLASLASLAAGCGGPVQDICKAECECEACSDDAYDDCIDNGKRIEEDAEAAGCQVQFDTYSACAESNYSCSSGDFDINGCGSEKFELTSCVEGTPSGSTSGGF
jgi:hypothetical protein